MPLSARGVVLAATCAMLAFGAAAARAGGSTAPAVVTAHPPLEAVPVNPGARAQQSLLRRCAAAARARRLQGAARDKYVRSCAAPRHPAPATRRGSRASP